jgi:hypothetical protein
MKSASGASWVGTVVAVAALAAIGIGGYNFLRTGCPLGTGCESGSAACESAAATRADSCCPLTEAAVKPVANAECCKGKSPEECCKTTGEGCSGASCGDMSGCEGEKAHCGENKNECAEAKGECPVKSGCGESSKATCPANPG